MTSISHISLPRWSKGLSMYDTPPSDQKSLPALHEVVL